MSNPTFRHGPITVQAGAALTPFRLVHLVDGLAVHTGAADTPHGVVAAHAAPEPTEIEWGNLAPVYPVDVAMHLNGVIPLETDDADVAVGAALYAAADGKVSTTGTVYVGWAAKAKSGEFVRTVLQLPDVPAAG